jgi:hypothetical protein
VNTLVLPRLEVLEIFASTRKLQGLKAERGQVLVATYIGKWIRIDVGLVCQLLSAVYQTHQLKIVDQQ